MKHVYENAYIELYEEKYNRCWEPLDSLISALEQLKKDREALQYSAERLGMAKTILWNTFFHKTPYNAEITKHNIEIINKVIQKLVALKVETDHKEGEDQVALRKKIFNVLDKNIRNLSDSGKTRTFFQYVINHLVSMDYSVRESNIIKPSVLEILCREKKPYTDGMQWVCPAIIELLESKEIPQTIFDKNKSREIRLASDIAEHAKWAFQNIYQYAYPNSYLESDEQIVRFHHGIEHVARAAMYARVFVNLYRKYGDEAAQELGEVDIKLIQIAILFHDAARENEGADHWDHDSAVLLYCYLTRILNVNPKIAKWIAEATANKDPSPQKGYFEIIENEKGEILWQFNKYKGDTFPPKNIFQKVIHDCDCLDIIRARNQFDARYLDFYKDIASKKGNEIALEEMAELVMEARSIIAIQGDLHIKPQEAIKKKYEHEKAYDRIIEDLDPKVHKILTALHGKLVSADQLQKMELVDLSRFDPEGEMTEANLKAGMREGKIFARAVLSPSAAPKPRKNKEIDADGSMAEKEIRKTMREEDINTKNRKISSGNKHGNPVRSVSVLGGGSGTYAPAGFLIFDPEISTVKKVSAEDFASGRGNKKKWIALQHDKEFLMSKEQPIPQEMEELRAKIKLGLYGKPLIAGSNYPEILYDISQYTAIFYTPDPTIGNSIAFMDFESRHKHAPLLQAIFIRRQFEIQYQHTHELYVKKYGESEGHALFIKRFGPVSLLPVYEYSGLHNQLKPVNQDELTDEHIIKIWVEMCSDFMRKNLSSQENTFDEQSIYLMSMDHIKIASMYNPLERNISFDKNQPADFNYPDSLRERISAAIEQERQKLIAEHEEALFKKINDNELSIFSKEGFFCLQFSPRLRELSIEKIKQQLGEFLSLGKTLDTQFVGDMTFKLSNEVLLIDDLNNFNECTTIVQLKISSCKLFVAYLLAKESGLTEEALIIKNKAIEAAGKLVLEWQTTDVQIANIINLHTSMSLIDPGNEIIKNIELLLSDFLKNKTSSLINKKYTPYKYYNDIVALHSQNLLKPEHLQTIVKGFESISKVDNTDDLVAYMKIAQLLDKSFMPVLDSWLQNNLKLYQYDLALLIDTLQGHFIFNQEHLQRFRLLVSGIHFANQGIQSVRIDIWMSQIDLLRSVVENNNFSEAQTAIIKKRFEEVVELMIEEEVALYHSKPYRMLIDLSSEIERILNYNFFLPVPEFLEKRFTRILMELDESSLTSLKLETIITIKKIHEQLPNRDTRQLTIEKLIINAKNLYNNKDKNENLNLPGLK